MCFCGCRSQLLVGEFKAILLDLDEVAGVSARLGQMVSAHAEYELKHAARVALIFLAKCFDSKQHNGPFVRSDRIADGRLETDTV